MLLEMISPRGTVVDVTRITEIEVRPGSASAKAGGGRHPMVQTSDTRLKSDFTIRFSLREALVRRRRWRWPRQRVGSFSMPASAGEPRQEEHGERESRAQTFRRFLPRKSENYIQGPLTDHFHCPDAQR